MIVFLLLVIIAILLFGSAAIGHAIGVIIALIAGALLLAFAFSLSATFWLSVGGLLFVGACVLFYMNNKNNRATALRIWEIYEQYLPHLSDQERRKAERYRDMGDFQPMSAILQRGAERSLKTGRLPR